MMKISYSRCSVTHLFTPFDGCKPDVPYYRMGFNHFYVMKIKWSPEPLGKSGARDYPALIVHYTYTL